MEYFTFSIETCAIEPPLTASISISGTAKEREHERDEADAVPQEKVVARETGRAGLRVHADGCEQHPEKTDDQPLEDILAARKESDESDAKNSEQEELGGAESQHDGFQNGDHDRKHARADDAAHARGRDAGAQRAARLALLGHRVAVDRGRGVVAVPGDAEHDAGNLSAGAVDRVHGEQENRALRHVHAEHERDGQRDRQAPADAGRGSHDETDQHRDEHEPHGLRVT